MELGGMFIGVVLIGIALLIVASCLMADDIPVVLIVGGLIFSLLLFWGGITVLYGEVQLTWEQMINASPPTPTTPSAPVDDQTRLILSGLWLGACFFLQRVFEKLFKSKGYALLTVCAAGFLLAFFTTNYFLLGGSVAGGFMGSMGDRS